MPQLDYVARPRLVWPRGLGRKQPHERKSASFRSGGARLSVPNSEGRLIAALEAFTLNGRPWRTEAVEIAADWPVGRLGGFLAGAPKKDVASNDPGVVLSFILDGRALTLPCDTYDRVADNLAAIAAHLNDVRSIERHGVATVEQMLSAHAALPRNAGDSHAWWQVLGVSRNATPVEVESAYRRLARERHPDNGGSDAAMAELNLARDAWREEEGWR